MTDTLANGITAPEIIDTEAFDTAILALNVPASTIRTVMGEGINEVMAAINAQGVRVAGPWFTHHLHAPGDSFDFEVSFPVEGGFKSAGRVQASQWPAMKVVRTTYHGGYEGLGAAWGTFVQWIAAQGLKVSDDLWEVYVISPESGPDSSTYVTQFNKRLID